jgi:hypothetical protein
MSLTRRVLPPEEFEKLRAIPPYDTGGLPNPTYWRIVVVERDGGIVATCALFDTVHWDCFWVEEADQGNPTVFKDLLEQSIEVMQQYGIAQVHTTIPADRPDLAAMLIRFGFHRAPGDLYYYARTV